MKDRFRKESKKKRVLLIEDNHINLRIMSRLLQGMGIEVVETKSEIEAIEYAIQEKFSMIFMCIFMPEMKGYETTKKIREQSKLNYATPIIAVTSNDYNSITDKMIEYGINDVISKPLKEDEINKLFDKSILEKTIPFIEYYMFDIKEFESFYNDNSLQKDIVITFIDEKKNDLERLDEAFNSLDLNKVYNALHYMKGSFSYLKANKILELTQQILNLLKEDELEEALLLKDTFYEDFNILHKELSAYISNA